MLEVLETVFLAQLSKKNGIFRGSLHIHTNILRTVVLLFWHNSKVYQGIFVIGYNISLFTAIPSGIVKPIMTHYSNYSLVITVMGVVIRNRAPISVFL